MRLNKSFKFIGALLGALLLAPNALFAASDVAASTKGADVSSDKVMGRVQQLFANAEIHAFGEAGYTFNATSDAENPIGVFETGNNDFNANAEIVFQDAAEGLWDIGFRTDLHFGTDIAEAISGDDDVDFEQAYLEGIVPFFGKEIKLTFGKFITHMGWELIPGYDSINDNITRSVSYGFGIPFTHTGLKATYQITDKAEFSLIGTNGWDNTDDNNDAKSIGTQLVVNPIKNLTIYANSILGPEQEDDNNDWRYLANLIFEYAATEKLTLVLDGIYGHEDNVDSVTVLPAIVSTTIGSITALDAATVSLISESDVDWGAIVGYARYQLTEKWAVSTRAEIFFDEDGARTGIDQDLFGLTNTLEYAINENARVRLEGRYDHSDEDFFDDFSDRNQYILALNTQLRF